MSIIAGLSTSVGTPEALSSGKKQTKHVGLMLYVIINGILYAILQKRGEWNHEKLTPESWPGGCQPTVHGKVEEGEDLWDALHREVREELGFEFESVLHYLSSLEGEGKYYKFEKDGNLYSVGLILPEDIGRMQLSASTGGLKLISRKKMAGIINLKALPKDQPVSSSVVAMFEDDKKLLWSGVACFDPNGE